MRTTIWTGVLAIALIVAVGIAGTAANSSMVWAGTPSQQAAEPPSKPRGLEATATHGQVVLTWNDPGDDSITGYVILRRVRVNNTGGDFGVLVADTGTAALGYTDDTVAAGLTYTYRIKAINAHGTSERSRWSHVDTPAAPEPQEEQAAEPPSKPRGLEATATHDSVTLTWDDPQDDSITGYVILRRIPEVDPQGQFSELVSNTGTAAATYTDDTVSAETRYTYRIKAINEHGTSERSRWYHIDTPAAPVVKVVQTPTPEPAQGRNVTSPARPTGLTAGAIHDTAFLVWDDPGDESITGYLIERAEIVNGVMGEFAVVTADTASVVPGYDDRGLEPETGYAYRVGAINEHGVSERSEPVEVTTLAEPESVWVGDEEEDSAPEHFVALASHITSHSDPDRLPTPTKFTASVSVTLTSVRLGWDLVPGADGYRVYVLATRIISGTERDWWVDPQDQFTDDDGVLVLRNYAENNGRAAISAFPINQYNDTPSFAPDHYVFAVQAYRDDPNSDDADDWSDWSPWRAAVVKIEAYAFSYDIYGEN